MNDDMFEKIKDLRQRRIKWIIIFKKFQKEFNTVSDIRLSFGRELNKRGIILEHKDTFQRYREFMQEK